MKSEKISRTFRVTLNDGEIVDLTAGRADVSHGTLVLSDVTVYGGWFPAPPFIGAKRWFAPGIWQECQEVSYG